jgi:hypothetical protein
MYLFIPFHIQNDLTEFNSIKFGINNAYIIWGTDSLLK